VLSFRRRFRFLGTPLVSSNCQINIKLVRMGMSYHVTRSILTVLDVHVPKYLLTVLIKQGLTNYHKYFMSIIC
jgi:hypothetical protein